MSHTGIVVSFEEKAGFCWDRMSKTFKERQRGGGEGTRCRDTGEKVKVKLVPSTL